MSCWRFRRLLKGLSVGFVNDCLKNLLAMIPGANVMSGMPSWSACSSHGVWNELSDKRAAIGAGVPAFLKNIAFGLRSRSHCVQ